MARSLELMHNRLYWEGGDQEGRMVKDKYRSFIKSLSYSYQAAEVQKVGETIIRKALINPDKNQTDYDDKILSIDYDYGFNAGDVFKWVGTDSYWLVYLQELTETAYFRSEIRRCRYTINWLVDGEIKSTYAYVRGPVETKIDFIQKGGISVDTPNLTLSIYVPFNSDNLDKFKRYDRFMFNGTTWEVQTVDSISTDGIIQVVAEEYYTNATLDDADANLTDAFAVVPVTTIDGETVPIEDVTSEIVGETFIKPGMKSTYTYDGEGAWSINNPKLPVTLTVSDDGATVEWTSMKSGQFTLIFTPTNAEAIEKIIVVESLF